MIEGDAGEFHPRRDLVADRVACLHAVLACDDRRTAAGRFVEVDPEERESRRGHGRRRGGLNIAAKKGIEAGEDRAPFGGRCDDGGLWLPRATRRQRGEGRQEKATA